MRAMQIVSGRAVPLDRSDVDTDQIIPSDWLKRVERTGFGAGLFAEWRDESSFVLNQPEYAEGFEPYRPRKQEHRFHIEDNKQNGDDVKANRIASRRVVIRIDAALVRHELCAIGTLRANDSGNQESDRDHGADNSEKKKNREVVLWHGSLESVNDCESDTNAEVPGLQAA